jgi:hypothetical protein
MTPRAPVSARHFSISVSAWLRPVRYLAETVREGPHGCRAHRRRGIHSLGILYNGFLDGRRSFWSGVQALDISDHLRGENVALDARDDDEEAWGLGTTGFMVCAPRHRREDLVQPAGCDLTASYALAGTSRVRVVAGMVGRSTVEPLAESV